MGRVGILLTHATPRLWTRLHARDLGRSHGDAAWLLLAHLAYLELERAVLQRALDPFPVPVRTLRATP
jgi:hypothetical protein